MLKKDTAAQKDFLCARTTTHAHHMEECKKQVSLASAKARAAVPSIAQPRNDGLAQQVVHATSSLE